MTVLATSCGRLTLSEETPLRGALITYPLPLGSNSHDCLILVGGVSYILLNHSRDHINPALRAVRLR
jgi:hypothetical protein